MVRRLAFLAVAVLLVASFSSAGEVMEAEGKVKAVSGNTVTVVDKADAEWAFEVTPDSVIKAKGASHKVKELDEAGEEKSLDKFVKADQKVAVKYTEKDGKAYVTELRVY